MSPCCGRPNNAANKDGEKGYYARYAYLSSAQRARQEELGVSKCAECDAYTAGDPCAVCGKNKIQPQVQAEEENKEG